MAFYGSLERCSLFNLKSNCKSIISKHQKCFLVYLSNMHKNCIWTSICYWLKGAMGFILAETMLKRTGLNGCLHHNWEVNFPVGLHSDRDEIDNIIIFGWTEILWFWLVTWRIFQKCPFVFFAVHNWQVKWKFWKIGKALIDWALHCESFQSLLCI